MKRILNQEERTFLSQAHPATRLWLITRLQKTKMNKTIKGSYLYLNTVEGNIYRQWHENCLNEMRRTKLHICVPDLFNFISQPEVSVTKALAAAQRQYARETNKTRQKHIGKMVAQIQRLADSETRLYRETKEKLINGQAENTLEDVAARIENADEIWAEYRLYTMQSIKHYNRLLKLGAEPSTHELYQCLDARFAVDSDIFTKQVSIVCSTYHKGQDVPAEVKDICFCYIVASLEYAGYLHASLIDYIFKNNEISERAFNLFCDAEKIIRSKGMNVLPATYAARLAKQKGLYEKPAAELSDSDVRILRIEHMFK